MPSNGVKGLEWDEANQFLWIGTEAGMVRFNGIDFRNLSKSDNPQVGLRRITNVIRDGNNRIFAFDIVSNKYMVSGSQLVYISMAGKTVNEKMKERLLTTGIDSILINATNPAIDQILAGGSVKRIMPLNDVKACLVLDIRGLLMLFSAKSTVPIDLVSEGTTIKEVFEVNHNHFVLCSDNKIRMIKDNKIEKSSLAIRDETGNELAIGETSLLVYQNGMEAPILFFENNAWLLEYNGQSFSAKSICSSVPTNSYIRYAQYNKKGNILFIGTDSKGLLLIRRNTVFPMKTNESGINQRNAYYSQVRLSAKSILTNEGHIVGATIPEKEIPISGTFSYRTYVTGDSLLWYCQYNNITRRNCLYYYNSHLKITKAFPTIAKYASPAVAVSKNKVYVVTLEGLGILESDSLRYLHRFSGIQAGNDPIDMIEIDGSLIFANCNSLMEYNTESGKLDTLFESKLGCMRTIRQFGDYLFIGTYGAGFYIYKKGIIRSIALDKNKFLLYTHCFVFDQDGFCWLSTNRGLFKAQTSDLINAYETKSGGVYYHYLGKNDGMETTEMNGGCSPCALILDTTTISFPTMDGLLWVNTKTAVPMLPAGNIYIDNITVDEVEYPVKNATSTLYLPSNIKEIKIALGYAAWCNKENIYIDYRLNSNDKWQRVDITEESGIRLTNLSQGHYELQIRKMNGFGKENYSYTIVNFEIATPWYKQGWFSLLMAVVVIGLFSLFFRIRTRQLKINQARLEKLVAQKTNELQYKNEVLEKGNTINTRLISIISHDIITPLKFLSAAGTNLLEKKNLMNEGLKDETIREITGTAKELQLLSTNILNWIKYQNENRLPAKEEFSIYELANQVISILNSIAKQKKLQLVNAIYPGLMTEQYFEPLKILIYNLITNAIHFSEKGNIRIEAVENESGHIIISVQDEGVGMTKDQIKNIMSDQFIITSANIDNRRGNGLGYLIIKDLVKMMEAELSIQSEKNKGTTVYVQLPINNKPDI